MDSRRSYKVEAAVAACRRACLGTGAPLTGYWLTIELLRESLSWGEDEVMSFRRSFVDSLVEDLTSRDDGNLNDLVR